MHLPKQTIYLLIALLSFTFAAQAQTIPAPQITCVATNEQTGDVNISWDLPTVQSCGVFIEYVIEGSLTPTGPFNLVAVISNQTTTTFSHIGANATVVDWYYKMYMRQNCPGATVDTSAVIGEQILYTPGINYVTVLPDNTVEINWQQSPNTAPDGFEVQFVEAGTGLRSTIDSVLGSSATSYIDATGSPETGSIEYYVQAYDDCNNTSGPNATHSTIYLTSDINSCAQEVTLTFTPYSAWPTDTIQNYELLVMMDGVQLSLSDLGNSYPAGGGPYSYVYDIEGLVGDSLSFTVIANNVNGVYSSSSNAQNLKLNALRSTAYNYITNASINVDGTVDLSWLADTSADLSYFLIKRGLDSLSLEVVDTVAVAPGGVSFENSYTDLSIDANEEAGSLYYQIETLDTCGFSSNSGIAKTIFLSTFFNENTGDNELDWNNYAQPQITLLNVTPFRLISESVLVPIETFIPDTLSYADPVANAISSNGAFCYRIESEYQYRANDLRFSRTFSTYSNVQCVDLPPVIYIPNAFVPSSNVNDNFKPVLLFPVDEYEFRIYDRWGKELFGTEDIIGGWDGSFNGERQPTGGYVYFVRVKTVEGRVEERRGVVALIR